MAAVRRRLPDDWEAGDGRAPYGSPTRLDPVDLPIRRSNPLLEAVSALSGGMRLALLLGVIAAVCLVVLGFVACPGPQPISFVGGPSQAAAQGVSQLGTVVTTLRDDVRTRLASGDWPVRGVVCIDAGHGEQADLTLTPIGPGSSEMQYVEPGGATGVATGVPEYEVALEMALRLQEKLEAMGVTVVMVRMTNDVVLSSEQRAQVANECGADLFIRLHCDGGDDPSVSGFSTLVPGVNEWTEPIYEASLQAAEIMHPIIIDETGANDMGIVERSDLAGFNFCQVPSVLYEMGFISNPDEDVRMNDPAYQDVLASAMADGAAAYLRAVS
ncbi:MAG: N-acetylmuramoyl-L-alanine amidase [Coriobacteriia bacterium]|nr:N-acetylmuramoyl-L-alanine amidase [Coriobacteriia bacterium]